MHDFRASMDHGDQSERLELCVSATIQIAALDTTHHSCANIPDFQMTPRNSEPACVVRFRKVGGEGFFLVFFGTGHNRTRVYSASCETTMHRTYRNNTNSQRKPKLESFLMGQNRLFVRVYQILRFHYIFTTERFSTMCDGRVTSGLSKQ